MRTTQSHTARESSSASALEDLRLPVQAKLAAAWTSFMFLYIYVDYFHLHKPGVIDNLRAGVVFQFDISPTLLTVMLASVAIPALMVMLSMTLPARVNRATNLVVAIALHPLLGRQRGRGVLGLGLLLRPLHRARGAAPGLHRALRLDLASSHRITGEHGNQPGQGVAAHPACELTAPTRGLPQGQATTPGPPTRGWAMQQATTSATACDL